MDKYVSPIYLSVTESAANTLTWSDPLTLGSSLFEKRALVLHKIEYNFNSLNLLLAADDYLTMALSVMEAETIDNSEPAIINRQSWQGTFAFAMNTLTIDFYQPLIVPAYRLYLGIQGASLAAAGNGDVRVYITTIDKLSESDYNELLQALNMVR